MTKWRLSASIVTYGVVSTFVHTSGRRRTAAAPWPSPISWSEPVVRQNCWLGGMPPSHGKGVACAAVYADAAWIGPLPLTMVAFISGLPSSSRHALAPVTRNASSSFGERSAPDGFGVGSVSLWPPCTSMIAKLPAWPAMRDRQTACSVAVMATVRTGFHAVLRRVDFSWSFFSMVRSKQ